MATAKKLPSGAWRVLVYSHTEVQDGKEKRIYESFTDDLKEIAELMAAQFVVDKKDKAKAGKRKKTGKIPVITVSEAIDKYIAANKNVLSETTVSGYKKIQKYAFEDIMAKNIYDLTDEILQIAISNESQRITKKKTKISPKTVHNEYGLISTALKFFKLNFDVNLPKIPIRIIELPDPETVISALKGTWVELPCLIAAWLSFSMSEIRGIKCSSVRNGNLYMENVLVEVDNQSMEKKTGKAEKRIRKHQIPPYIMELIEAEPTYQEYIKNGTDGYLISLTRNQIYHRFTSIMKNHGYTMSFHQLRHLNASIMLALNIPEKYAMERGGWKTSYTMKSVYQHTFSKERLKYDDEVNSFFEKIVKD